jgi:uncharacterized protein (TIGR02145 family)
LFLFTIEQGSIQAELVLTPDDIQDVVFHYEGITQEPANVKGSVTHVTNWNINTELYSGIRLTGKFVSDMTFILDINMDGSSLNSAKSGIITTETLTLQLSAALKREFEKDITIATITFAPIIIPIVGPLALVVVPEVEVKLGLEGYVSGTATCSATQQIYIDAGIQYAKTGGWSAYKTFTNEFSNTKPVLEKANAEASIYIQPELSTKLYNVAGPYINTKIYGKLEVDANEETVEKEEPWWKLSVGINLNAGMNVEIFDLATLNYEKSDIIGYEWLIAQSPTKPKVTTGDITNIQTTTASCSGEVTKDGNAAVTARGICWSTSQNPTIENSKTSNGTGTGTFTGDLTGLAANTSYYVRAYATNSEGTAYGVEKAFTTLTEGAEFSVTTGAVTNITTNSASCSGNVTADDDASVTARGLCWSTSQNPTTADSKTSNGTGTGTFSAGLTGLSPNTTYYVRAYATRSEGTTYGEQRLFQTLEEEELTGTFTDNRDNKIYNYVTIGSQVWMAENLKYLPAAFSNHDILSNTEPLYYHNNYSKYGVLYNWPAAMEACPQGWHLPSHDEWNDLINYLGGATVAGGKMKEEGFEYWDEPNEGATNESGFKALPGGTTDWARAGMFAFFWSSTLDPDGAYLYPWRVYLMY